MGRISLGSFLLVAALGLAAGCSSTSSSRFNLFNHSKPVNDNCVDVGAGPVCEGQMMGGGDRLPAESGFMLPGDGTMMPGTVVPGPGTTTMGPIIQGNGAPPNNTYMPPASGSSTVQPQRLKPLPNGAQQ
jgi:hypothetical protein